MKGLVIKGLIYTGTFVVGAISGFAGAKLVSKIKSKKNKKKASKKIETKTEE